MNDLLYLRADILKIGLWAYYTTDCLNLLSAERVQLTELILQQIIQGAFKESYKQANRV